MSGPKRGDVGRGGFNLGNLGRWLGAGDGFDRARGTAHIIGRRVGEFEDHRDSRRSLLDRWFGPKDREAPRVREPRTIDERARDAQQSQGGIQNQDQSAFTPAAAPVAAGQPVRPAAVDTPVQRVDVPASTVATTPAATGPNSAPVIATAAPVAVGQAPASARTPSYTLPADVAQSASMEALGLKSGTALDTAALNRLSAQGILSTQVPSTTPGEKPSYVFTNREGKVVGGFERNADGQSTTFLSRGDLDTKLASQNMSADHVEKMLADARQVRQTAVAQQSAPAPAPVAASAPKPQQDMGIGQA